MFLHQFYTMTVLYCFRVYPVFLAFIFVGLEGWELGFFVLEVFELCTFWLKGFGLGTSGLTGFGLGSFWLEGFELGTFGLAGFEPGSFGFAGLGFAGSGLWGLGIDVSLEGSLLSGGGYSVLGSSISLEFVIPGNRLSSSFTVLRLRLLILMSSWIIAISCAVEICCVCIAALTGTLFPITAKLRFWPFCCTQMPTVQIELGWSMAAAGLTGGLGWFGKGLIGTWTACGPCGACAGWAGCPGRAGCAGCVTPTNETPVIRYIIPFVGAVVHCNAYCRILPS